MARNMTEHIKECGTVNQMPAGTPPTSSPYVAFHNSAHFSKSVNFCCAGYTGTFGLQGSPDDCYIYCNVTEPATISSVKSCVRLDIGNNTDGEGVYISIQGNEDKENAAIRPVDAWKSGIMGYLVLALGVSTTVWSLS